MKQKADYLQTFCHHKARRNKCIMEDIRYCKVYNLQIIGENGRTEN